LELTVLKTAMRSFINLCFAAFVLATGSSAFAQDSAQAYPNKAIRIVVTFPVGGPADIIARAVGQKLSEAWSQPVIIDNRPGAGGNIGMNLVAKAPPDGYTLILSSFGTMVIGPFVYSSLAYDPIKDLTPITLAATSWLVLAVNPSLQANSVKELIELAKKKPGELTMGSSGYATPSHLGGALFQSVAGISLTHVPYKGGGESIPALVAGQVQTAVETPIAIVPQVKAGKLRALLVASPERSQLLPDVPTAKELGLPGLEVGSWYGFHAPAGTPQPIIDKIYTEMAKVMNTPEMRERFAAIGAETIANTPAQFGAFIDAESKRWEKVIRAAGVKVE
jgi:tripartite-type tricarboxylate transporter receptor subunit TctC